MSQMSIDDAMRLGLEHHRENRLNEAEAIYRKVLQQAPQHADALYLLGHLALDVNQPAAAVQLFSRAIAITPQPPQYFFKLAHAYDRLNDMPRALTAYDEAIKRDPKLANAYNDRGICLKRLGREREAMESYKTALSIEPDNVLAITNLGGAYHATGNLEEAIPLYRRAIELRPNHEPAYSNLGLALAQQGQWDDAIASYEKAIQLSPDFTDAHANLSLSLLVRGDFERGWEEYEWRRKLPDFPSTRRDYPQPQWDGSDPSGKTILVFGEQGYGDTLQFIRYASLVKARGAKVIFESQPPIKSLLQDGADVELVVTHGDPMPQFDLQVPLMSLPRIFGTRVHNIPGTVPYLKADPAKTLAWKEKLAGDAQFKVGLVWAGNPKNFIDRLRSCSLKAFAPLAAVKGASFYSLQKGDAAKQAATPPDGLNVIDLTDQLNDFADTAAMIENLDLVISIETAVAHLTGALARPIWTLTSAVPAWQWLLDREDSPWYPTMRLWRQSKLGDWESVLKKVADELNDLIARKTP